LGALAADGSHDPAPDAFSYYVVNSGTDDGYLVTFTPGPKPYDHDHCGSLRSDEFAVANSEAMPDNAFQPQESSCATRRIKACHIGMRNANAARGFSGPLWVRQKKFHGQDRIDTGRTISFSVVSGHVSAILVLARRASNCLIRRP
jgi:hypothetical protein